MAENHLVAGLKEDCLDLLSSFLARNTHSFQIFSEEWKQKQFHFIFTLVTSIFIIKFYIQYIIITIFIFISLSGHIFDYELLQFTENCMVTVKNLFLQSKSTLERMAILYLMYSVYFKQPTNDFCKFRLTFSDWNEMKQFYNLIVNNPNYFQARLIFWRLWQTNAFRFVAFEDEYGVELNANNTRELHEKLNDFQTINPLVVGQIDTMANRSSGLLTAFEIIQIGYNEMKEHLTETITECSGMTNTNCLRDILFRMEKIKARFDGKKPTRVELRERVNRKKLSSLKIVDGGDEYVTSCSDSESDRKSDDCFSDIGTKRSNLKRKAMQKSDSQKQSNNNKNRNEKQKLTIPEMKSEKRLTSSTHQQPEVLVEPKRLQRTKKRIELNGSNGNLFIFSPGYNYTRKHNSTKTSVVRKEFDNCPM